MNWELLFKSVTTENQYWSLRATGLAWELFPDYPESYQEFLKKLVEWELAEAHVASAMNE